MKKEKNEKYWNFSIVIKKKYIDLCVGGFYADEKCFNVYF